MLILTHAFFSRRLFSQWMQLWHFKLVWMIAHERFEGNLRLQVPGKVFRESGPSISLNVKYFKWHTCQVSWFWGESPDYASRLPSFGGRWNLRIFYRVSWFLRIYVLFHLKVSKLYVFTAIMTCPIQLIGTNQLKMTTDDNFGDYHKQ